VADWVETESATFWKAPDMNAADIDTTVYFLPAALIYEKPGTILNSGRWLQWRYQAVEPWEDAKPDYEICDVLWKAIVDLYKKEDGVAPEPVVNTKWDYYVDGKIDPRPVAWALNGYNYAEGGFENGAPDLLSTFANLKADGSTACGMWIYTGFWANNDAPLDPAEQAIGSRVADDPTGLGLHPKWSFAWPLNRRIIYNRASADLEGKPWNPNRVLVEWTGEKWVQNDVGDFVAVSNGTPVPPNNKAFMMLWEQNARLESYGMGDGPLPEHYEPFESPADNKLNGRQNSPCVRFAEFESVKRGDRSQYPIAVTTYSVTEHWQTGGQTRTCPALNEAMPEQFVEMSVELAAEKGIENGERVRVFNNRGSVEVMALVTPRFKPFKVNGETVHQVGMTHHFGWAGDFATGDIVNDLPPNVGDPNCWVPEYKTFLVDIEKA
jgi:formate dehydrogenase major subunit